MQKIRQHPILILLIINIVIGLFTFRDYGLSWDEPLYYDYGQASETAYSIPARLNGTFDLEKTFGASASDHVTRGPAYLVIAGQFQNLLEFFGLDMASAWHLTNFLTFQVGLFFLYLLTRRWLDRWPATVSTAFFATQPVFWNHAFMNPKDMPFAVFFLISIYYGLRMIDSWTASPQSAKAIIRAAILPGILLGLTTAIRFIGPYAVVVIFLFFHLHQKLESHLGIYSLRNHRHRHHVHLLAFPLA
ncbi:MAG: glycosyltransferase family 39 protein [Anaerolineales bacterium]|nr:glycosyltransferase family 39 protein [Anaerolineales bacterium]